MPLDRGTGILHGDSPAPPTGPSVHERPGLDKRERGVWPPGVPVATVYNAEAQRIPQADPARVSEGTRAPPTPGGTIGRADHEISGPSSGRCSLHGQESGGRVECGPLARDATGPTPKGHKRERPCTGDHAPKNLATLAPCRTARPIPISHAASHAALALARPLGVGCTCGWRSGDPGDTHVRPIRPPRYRNYPPGSGT